MNLIAATMEWISVNDRLPAKGQEVLVFNPQSEYGGIGIDVLDPDSDGYTWVEHSNAYEHFQVVCLEDVPCVGPSEDAPYSHWCPIPKPPRL